MSGRGRRGSCRGSITPPPFLALARRSRKTCPELICLPRLAPLREWPFLSPMAAVEARRAPRPLASAGPWSPTMVAGSRPLLPPPMEERVRLFRLPSVFRGVDPPLLGFGVLSPGLGLPSAAGRALQAVIFQSWLFLSSRLPAPIRYCLSGFFNSLIPDAGEDRIRRLLERGRERLVGVVHLPLQDGLEDVSGSALLWCFLWSRVGGRVGVLNAGIPFWGLLAHPYFFDWVPDLVELGLLLELSITTNQRHPGRDGLRACLISGVDGIIEPL